jgi:hypothetical protein
MAIEIHRHGGRYTAVVSPPHGSGLWTTPTPLRARELVDRLRELGCHTTDIADAFNAAYPRWQEDADD